MMASSSAPHFPSARWPRRTDPLLRLIRLFVAILMPCVLLACAMAPPGAASDSAERTVTAFVVIRGWHSDIAIPADALGPRLAGLRDTFPGARYFIFGLGERSFLLREQPGLLDMITALLPSPTALLVTAIRVSPPDAFTPPAEVIAVPLTPRGLANLGDFIASSFEYTPQGAPRLLTTGPYPGGLFYYATRTYSAVFTCNTWTAEALASAGLPVRTTGVLFGGDVARQARLAAE